MPQIEELRIRVEWLLGTFAASDLGEHEWPPSASRLFQALASSHYRGDLDEEMPAREDEREALLTLEGVSPAYVTCHAYRPHDDDLLQVAVASADPAAASGAIGALPGHHRHKNLHSVRQVWPSAPSIDILWRAPGITRHAAAVQRMCSRISYLGRPESVVMLRVVGEGPEPNLVPAEGRPAEQLIKVPRPGYLHDLDALWNRIKAEEAMGKSMVAWKKTTTGLMGFVSVRRQQEGEASERPAFSRPIPVIVESERPLNGHRWPAFVEAYRARLMDEVAKFLPSEGPLPEWISGHSACGGPARASHIAFFPMLEVGHRHSRGWYRGVGVVLPSESEEMPEVGAVLAAISSLEELTWSGGRMGARLSMVRPTDRVGAALQADRYVRPARVWGSVTPVILPGHPRRDRPDLEKEYCRQVKKACRHVGLPEPDHIEIMEHSPVHGGPWRGSMPVPMKYAKSRSVHVELHFPHEVGGPILIGAGRYMGWGICMPILRDNEQKMRATA